jgi:hypothetical protein
MWTGNSGFPLESREGSFKNALDFSEFWSFCDLMFLLVHWGLVIIHPVNKGFEQNRFSDKNLRPQCIFLFFQKKIKKAITEVPSITVIRKCTKLEPVSNPKNCTKLEPVSTPKNCTKLEPVSTPKNCTKLEPVSNPKNCTKLEPVSTPKKCTHRFQRQYFTPQLS